MRHVALLVGLAALAGCRSSPQPAGHAMSPDPSAGDPATAPMDVEGTYDTTWTYLAARYDADGDGIITVGEYDRSDEGFRRLDRDVDGTISAADFADAGPGGGMSALMARRVTATYFQDPNDADTRHMPVAELEASIGVYDDNGDGVVDRSEFEARAAERRVDIPGSDHPMVRRMFDGIDGYTVIVAGVDADADGRLGRAELLAFFEELDDGGLAWTLRDPFGDPGAPAADAEPATGPRVGTMAPDFTLRPPDGGPAVTLSSFRGSVPVALVFGSYT